MIFTTCLEPWGLALVHVCACAFAFLPGLFNVRAKAIKTLPRGLESVVRERNRRMKEPLHFINYYMLFSFSFFHFFLFFKAASNSLFIHIYASSSFLPLPLHLLSHSLYFTPLTPFFSFWPAWLSLFSSSLLAGVDLAMLH